MKELNFIVAVDNQWGIGKEGGLLCYISPDLKYFREKTTGHTVLTGRKTLATFPKGAPLPKRKNLILSKNTDFLVEGAQVVHSVEEALAQLDEGSFVIGGEQVYRAFLPYCTRGYVTKIKGDFSADRFFPNLDEDDAWQVTNQLPEACWEGITYQYLTYERSGSGD